jgi:hypothetical protein
MGNRLPHGLGGRGHWLDMLGGGEGQVNASRIRHSLDGAYMKIHFHLVSLLLLATLPLSAQTAPASGPNANSVQHQPQIQNQSTPTPTVFQADEGDRWMLLGKKSLIFKVDPVTAGSETLMVGTEEMPPGTEFRRTSTSTKMKSYSSTRARCTSRWLVSNTTQERELRFSFHMETGSV